MELEDVNEFSPEFERQNYEFLWESGGGGGGEQWAKLDDWVLLGQVRAHDHDCNRDFQGRVCAYELQSAGSPEAPQAAGSQAPAGEPQLDAAGQLRARSKWLEQRLGQALKLGQPSVELSLQALAYDCAGKKSQRPAAVQVRLARKRRAKWKGK